MDHLEILEEAGRTIGSPARYQKGRWITDRGGCSLGHVVVACSGEVRRDLMPAEAARQCIHTDAEAVKAVRFLALAMLDDFNRLVRPEVRVTKSSVLNDPRVAESVITNYNDHPQVRHEDVVSAFAIALRMARFAKPAVTEAVIFPEDPPKIVAIKPTKPEPVPTLDFSEVDSILTESAENEELVAA